jgi:hypothetical protein
MLLFVVFCDVLMAAPRRHVTTKFELKLTLRSLSPSYVTLKTASSRRRDYYSPPWLYFGFKQGRREARADQMSTNDPTIAMNGGSQLVTRLKWETDERNEDTEMTNGRASLLSL